MGTPLEDRSGSLIYDAAGYLGLTIEGPDADPAEADRSTADAAPAPAFAPVAYFGQFTVDEAAGVVTHHVAGHLYPDGAASAYRYSYTLSGNTLTLQWPAAADGSPASLTWVRAPDLPAADLSDAHRQLFGAYRIESVSRHTTDAFEVEINQYDDGYLFYTPSGRMSVHLLASEPAPNTGGHPANDELLLRTAHYFGPFSLNEVAGCITCPGPRDQGYLIHDPVVGEESGSGPAEVRRYYEMDGTDLTLRPPRHMDEEGREVITAFRWARLPPP